MITAFKESAKALLFIGSIVFVSACSIWDQGPYFPGMSNRGLVPVSTTNAYVGSNLFLAKEMEKSPELYNFIRSRGAPHAIRVNERPNRAPQVVMYYPREDALYISELDESNGLYNWIVRGPHRIPRYDSASLNQPGIDILAEPQLLLFENVLTFRPTKPQPSLKTVAIPKLPTQETLKKPPHGAIPALPTKRKPTARPTNKKSVRAAKPSVTSPTPYKPLNIDQMAIQMSQGFAERDRNGDVIHTVKSESETIEEISKWYTGSDKNSEAILKATGLEGVRTMTKGLRVRVPLALVVNTKQMQPK